MYCSIFVYKTQRTFCVRKPYCRKLAFSPLTAQLLTYAINVTTISIEDTSPSLHFFQIGEEHDYRRVN
jgi:hypothetical protein